MSKMNEVLAEAYTATLNESLKERGFGISASQVPDEFRLLPDPRDPFITEVLRREQEILEHLEWSKR